MVHNVRRIANGATSSLPILPSLDPRPDTTFPLPGEDSVFPPPGNGAGPSKSLLPSLRKEAPPNRRGGSKSRKACQAVPARKYPKIIASKKPRLPGEAGPVPPLALSTHMAEGEACSKTYVEELCHYPRGFCSAPLALPCVANDAGCAYHHFGWITGRGNRKRRHRPPRPSFPLENRPRNG